MLEELDSLLLASLGDHEVMKGGDRRCR